MQSSAGWSQRLRPGARLGPFVIQDRIGRGGMGLVFRAQAEDGRLAALKVLLADEGGSRRFGRESEALKALDHEGIVSYLGASEGPPAWLAMELVDGEDYAQTLKRGVSHDDAASAVAQAAAAMAHAHERGVIHRDLKPANLLVRRADGKVLVTDFGLTRKIDGSRFTKTGTLVGTVLYMAPEQVYGQRRIGPAADVWALGVILYEALTRELPFDEGEALATTAAIAHGKLRPLRRIDRSIPDDLVATCQACLRKDPGERPSAAELARALSTRRPVGGPARVNLLIPLGSLAVTLSLLTVGLAIAKRSEPGAPPAAGVDAVAEGSEPRASQPTPAPGIPPGPWPSPDPDWTRRWALGQAAPELPASALWSDPGRVAAPLAAARVGAPGAFLGEPTAPGDGRVEVRYTELGRALRAEARNPTAFFLLGQGDANTVVANGGEARVLSPNDGSPTRVYVGGARWSEPRVGYRARRVERIDTESVTVIVGALPSQATLTLSGRAKRVTVAVGNQPAGQISGGLSDHWQDVLFQPGAEGERVSLDGIPEPKLGGALQSAPTPGPVVFAFSEIHANLSDLVVAGRVMRPDVPALAITPMGLPTSASVAAAFDVEGAGLGGPLVALVDARGDQAVSLEADGDLLLLRVRGRIVARAESGGVPKSGWLQLERRGDTVRGRLEAATPVTLEHRDPLPLPCQLRAAYGSTAPQVRFSSVEVHSGPEDSGRASWDAAFEGGGAEAALALDPQDATGRWRQAALLLARASVPEFAGESLRGFPGHAERRRVAARAAELLVEVAGEDAQLRADALARALLARLVAADGDGADGAARDLVGLLGVEAAGEALNPLERIDGEPVLLRRVARGYASVIDPDGREAGLKAALVLLPDRRGDTLVELAGNIRLRRNPPPTQADLERAMSLFAEARRSGTTGDRVLAWEGETLFDLGRFDESLDRFQQGAKLKPKHYWAWFRSMQCLDALERPRAALEPAIGALAFEPGSQLVRREFFTLCKKLLDQGPMDGLLGAALHAFARVARQPQLAPGADAIKPGDAPRDRDLAAYVGAQLGAFDPPRGTRPTAVLARARMGDAAARAALAEAARVDPLVRHLALLDPQLSSLVR